MIDNYCGVLHFHAPHSWGDLNWCPGDPTHPAENDAPLEWECRPCLALKGSDCICPIPPVTMDGAS